MSEYHLLDRQTFFSDLVAEIKRAQKLIMLDAYIWIADEVGEMIGQGLLEAADRGVTVLIRNDTSGSLYEYTPGRVPFFFDESYSASGFWQSCYSKASGLLTMRNFNRVGYFIYGRKPRPKIQFSRTFLEMGRHKNIIILSKPFLITAN